MPRDQIKAAVKSRFASAHFIDAPFSEELVKSISIQKEAAGKGGQRGFTFF